MQILSAYRDVPIDDGSQILGGSNLCREGELFDGRVRRQGVYAQDEKR